MGYVRVNIDEEGHDLGKHNAREIDRSGSMLDSRSADPPPLDRPLSPGTLPPLGASQDALKHDDEVQLDR